MAKPYSEELRRRVVEAVEDGATIPEAAEQFGVSVSSATRYRLPAVHALRVAAAEGALISYDIPELFQQAAGYADRMLRGEKPGDLQSHQVRAGH